MGAEHSGLNEHGRGGRQAFGDGGQHRVRVWIGDHQEKSKKVYSVPVNNEWHALIRGKQCWTIEQCRAMLQ